MASAVVKDTDIRVSVVYLELGFRNLELGQNAAGCAQTLESALTAQNVQTESAGAYIVVVKGQQQCLWEEFVGRGAVAHKRLLTAQLLFA